MIVAEEPVLERGLYDGTIRLAIDRPRGLGVHLGRTSTMCGTDADPARAQVVTTDSIGLADIQRRRGLDPAASRLFPNGRIVLCSGAGISGRRAGAAPRPPGYERIVLGDGDVGRQHPAGAGRGSRNRRSDRAVHFGPRSRSGRAGLEVKAGAAGADRPPLSHQPRHGVASLRCPAADRGRRAGQCVGGRSTAHTGQGPLGSYPHGGCRLYPARRRWSGF